MTISKVPCIVIVILASFAGHSYSKASIRPVPSDSIETAIGSLCSVDVSERTEAKKLLLANRSESLKPLLDLYRRLRNGTRVCGNEPATRNESTSLDQVAENETEEFANERLCLDVIDLLTQLRSEEAVKPFIDYLYVYPCGAGMGSYGEPVCGEMRALIEMGSLAVPEIIEVLSTARDQAAKTRLSGTAEHYKSIGFQGRLIRVLGRIGDPKALPLLEELASDQFLVSSVNEAKSRILNNTRREHLR